MQYIVLGTRSVPKRRYITNNMSTRSLRAAAVAVVSLAVPPFLNLLAHGCLRVKRCVAVPSACPEYARGWSPLATACATNMCVCMSAYLRLCIWCILIYLVTPSLIRDRACARVACQSARAQVVCLTTESKADTHTHPEQHRQTHDPYAVPIIACVWAFCSYDRDRDHDHERHSEPSNLSHRQRCDSISGVY